jgi:hypothetical protein
MATATAEPKEDQLTEKEINELASKASEVLFGAPTKTDEEKAKEKADAEAAAKAAEETKAAADKKAADDKAAADKVEADKKAAEAAAAAPAKPAKTPTADEIADRVADRMKPAKAEATKEPELSADDQRNRDVLAFMAQEQPEFGRLLKRFDAFIPAEKNYRERWEKANPGESYDPTNEAHADFYKANDPIQTEADQAAFDRAQNRLEARQEAEKVLSHGEAKRMHAEAVKAVTAKLANHQDDVTKELLKETDGELAKIEPKKLREEDPLADAAIRPYVPALAAMTAELTKAFTPGLNYQFSDNNPLHVTLMQTIYGYENELLALPEKDRLSNGRVLAPIEEFNKMTPEQKSKHWTIWMEPNAVRALLVRDFSAKAREDLTLYRSKAGKPAADPAGNGTPKPKEEKTKEPPKDKGKKEFPNTSGGASDGTRGGADAIINPSDAKKITESLFAT